MMKISSLKPILASLPSAIVASFKRYIRKTGANWTMKSGMTRHNSVNTSSYMTYVLVE